MTLLFESGDTIIFEKILCLFFILDFEIFFKAASTLEIVVVSLLTLLYHPHKVSIETPLVPFFCIYFEKNLSILLFF